jgi:hypothetical protein
VLSPNLERPAAALRTIAFALPGVPRRAIASATSRALPLAGTGRVLWEKSITYSPARTWPVPMPPAVERFTLVPRDDHPAARIDEYIDAGAGAARQITRRRWR